MELERNVTLLIYYIPEEHEKCLQTIEQLIGILLTKLSDNIPLYHNYMQAIAVNTNNKDW